MVACLTDAHDRPVSTPLQRCTADRAHAVVAVVGQSAVPMRLQSDELLKLAIA